MESLGVECLSCGTSRIARRDAFGRFESPECPHCGYLGWAPVHDPAEVEPADRRKQSLYERRLPSVA